MHQLRICTHAEYLRLPSSDRERWRYFFAKEPIGFHAENWRAGVAVASLVNTMLNVKSSDAIKPSDIYPLKHNDHTSTHKPADPQAVRELIQKMRK